jgi:hypothetical protein
MLATIVLHDYSALKYAVKMLLLSLLFVVSMILVMWAITSVVTLILPSLIFIGKGLLVIVGVLALAKLGDK